MVLMVPICQLPCGIIAAANWHIGTLHIGILFNTLIYMNKRILSLFVLSAALFSVQAQQDKGGISSEMLNQIKQSYQGTSADKALRNAIGSNDIRKLALNQDNMTGLDTYFSIKVDSKGITDQKSSGRCWLFTGLNVMRAKRLQSMG